MSEGTGVRLALVTAPSSEAEALARSLVEDRVAACVNILPGVRSTFRWEGKVETAEESLLLLKVSAAGSEGLPAEVAARHPYDVPEVLLLDIAAGLPAYLSWVRESTGVSG